MITIILLFRIIICLVLWIVSIVLLGDSIVNNYNKIILFECGVLYRKLTRVSFSLRFFLIVILFLVFDIEIVLFIPASLLRDFSYIEFRNLIIEIIFIVVLGLFYEWNEGRLNWIFNDK